MKYSKPHLSFQQQASQLISRGLRGSEAEIIDKLKAVSYYRLSAYWLPLTDVCGIFTPDTSIEQIWHRYTFDRQLRLATLDAIERVEVSVRTAVTYLHSNKYGALGYVDHNNLPKLSSEAHRDMLSKIESEVERSKEGFVQDFFSKYNERYMPLWMTVEVMSMGATLTMFRGLEAGLKQKVARMYGISDRLLLSWFVALNSIRNICAHHGRLWDRELGYRPFIPNKNSDWKDLRSIDNGRIFVILSILKYMLNIICPQSSWDKRLIDLLEKYPDIPLDCMGFPEGWQETVIWRGNG